MSVEAPFPDADDEATVVPRPAATVMLLRDRADGMEVLLLQRAASTPFVPGAHVFPGGAVDDGDADHDDIVDGLAAEEADRILGVQSGGRAYWLAAVRECVEEAGVVLAIDADGRSVTDQHPVFTDLDATRDALEDGTRTLADLYREHGLRVPLDRVAYVSRWITPELSPRRYDARFFAAAMVEGQDAGADGWEAVDAGWWKPTQALADWQAGRIELIEPTVVSLQLLCRFTSTVEALDAIRCGAGAVEGQG
ncbi:NUDIX domain-containing protein [Acidimicrobiia bacterium EGI L10123]|uniref:NUDIX hydrolase n=1 Tax=Salinilacustrithrix flava TaxID=2957203 RepID=UPI003D7C33BA|nr:NUDIX domain-containing protein [Acidimicrobiia bacterium EGI L10123]